MYRGGSDLGLLRDAEARGQSIGVLLGGVLPPLLLGDYFGALLPLHAGYVTATRFRWLLSSQEVIWLVTQGLDFLYTLEESQLLDLRQKYQPSAFSTSLRSQIAIAKCTKEELGKYILTLENNGKRLYNVLYTALKEAHPLELLYEEQHFPCEVAGLVYCYLGSTKEDHNTHSKGLQHF